MQNIDFRKPTIDDASEIWTLIQECKPLDPNSKYAYLLLCSHFRDTCVVAEKDGDLLGFGSAYTPPNKQDTLFVWQVAVKQGYRKTGLAKKMMEAILARPTCKDILFLEGTVTPSNKASMSFFASLTAVLNSELRQEKMFEKNHFGSSGHEEENLVRIGPLTKEKPMELGIR